MAVSEALKSNMLHMHGCVLIDSVTHKIRSFGHNSWKQTTRGGNKHGCFTRHAEEEAMRGIPVHILRRCMLIVVRISNAQGELKLALSAPCAVCTKIILEKNINKVYYSTSDTTF